MPSNSKKKADSAYIGYPGGGRRGGREGPRAFELDVRGCVAQFKAAVAAFQQHQSGEHTIADHAELFSVSRATVYRVLERHQTPAAAPLTFVGQ
ncbi:helix-turn-helix domain-containing protein [Streptomyces sp. NPDC056178]|uniref:helix-turn-helix domain-containing protein n=1 Tax=unclassified Streptomyces TaxID=2593676 RepID=UPI0035E3B3C6